MAVYTVANAKGGSTKTTTAAEVVAGLSRLGRTVCAIDLDRQGNFTTRMGIDRRTDIVNGVAADVLTGNMSLQDAAMPAPAVTGAHIVAGTHDLTTLDARPELITALRDLMPAAQNIWDDVVIDTPGSISLVTLAALAAADQIIAPAACETESFDQLDELVKVVGERVNRLQPGQQVRWVIPTRYDGRRSLDQEVVDELERKFPGRVTTPIREAVAVKDSYTGRQPVSVYAPGSPVAPDYIAALNHIIRPTPRKDA